MKYIKINTQEQRILKLLQEKGSIGVYVYELQTPKPQGLGIAQYNARIWGLRKKGYLIKNIVPGHFVLSDDYVGDPAKNPSQVTTTPQKGIADVIREGMDNQVRVWSDKLGRYTWEDRLASEQQQIKI